MFRLVDLVSTFSQKWCKQQTYQYYTKNLIKLISIYITFSPKEMKS